MLFNVLGSEFDILLRWISIVVFVLFGVWVGIAVSEKKFREVRVGGMTGFLIIFSAGFLAAPFVGVGVLMVVSMFPFSRGIEPIVFGGSVAGYLLLYMAFWFWLRKKYRKIEVDRSGRGQK